jgi:hypothetical protein
MSIVTIRVRSVHFSPLRAHRAQNVEFINNPAKFSDVYRFRVTFDCIASLKDGPRLTLSASQRLMMPHRPRVEAHLRLLPGQRSTRPRARRLPRRARPLRRQLLRIRRLAAGPVQDPRGGRPGRRRAYPHGVVQGPGVRARGVLPEHRVRQRGDEGDAAGEYHVPPPCARYQRQAARNALSDKMVRPAFVRGGKRELLTLVNPQGCGTAIAGADGRRGDVGGRPVRERPGRLNGRRLGAARAVMRPPTVYPLAALSCFVLSVFLFGLMDTPMVSGCKETDYQSCGFHLVVCESSGAN